MSRIIGATFLIAGTCVGAGMLALPVETGAAGFLPSFVIITLAYIFMISTGLLLAEANLWMEEGAHIVTMSSKLLGKFGKLLSIILYIFMGYGSLIAYDSGGSTLIQNLFSSFGFDLARWQACTMFGIVFGLMIFFGTHFVSKFNTYLVFGMIIAYVLIVVFGLREVSFSKLTYIDWSPSLSVLPLLLATFSFQMIIPSITPYLERDPKALRLSIILGTTIPYVVYMLWEVIVLGIVPVFGDNSLTWAFKSGIVATQPLRAHANIPLLPQISECFAFFALVTSFLGIALGLYDFLSDFTKVKKQGLGKFVLIVAVIFPTLFFSILFPNAFLIALDATGGYGDAILSGLIPISMVWIGRYHKKIEGPYKVKGGKIFLLTLSFFAFVVLAVQTTKIIQLF